MEVTSCSVSFLLFLCVGVFYKAANGDISTMQLRKLEKAHSLIHEELSTIKAKVWIDMAAEIEEFRLQLNSVLTRWQEEKRMLHARVNAETEKLEQLFQKERLQRDKLEKELTLCTKHAVALLNDVIHEKILSRKLHEELNQLESKLNCVEEETAPDIKSLTEQIHTMQRGFNRTVMMLENLENRIQEKMVTEFMDGQREEEKMKPFGKAGFISEWFLMNSQDDRLSQVILAHGLGEIPFKVDVQVRENNQFDAYERWWVYRGSSAFQSDDDTNITYGGIVYLYNSTHIILFAPKQNNNNSVGKIIHTGEGRYIGTNHKSASEAYVRVRAWGPENMMFPDFVSKTLPIDINNKKHSFYEIKHGLGDYPALVTVYVYTGQSDMYYVSEGIGASVKHVDQDSAFGGVLWGYNNESIRVWTLYAEETDREFKYQTLFGKKDGWGLKGYNFNGRGMDWARKGNLIVRAWSKKHFTRGRDFIQHGGTSDSHALPILEQISLQNDLLSLQVQVEDGINKGYRFQGYGSAQAQGQPYSGLVYAYHLRGGIRVWTPDPSQEGYTWQVHSPYGNGINVQATNNVSYVLTLIKS